MTKNEKLNINFLNSRFNMKNINSLIESCSNKNITASSKFVNTGKSRIMFSLPKFTGRYINLYSVELIINVKDILNYSNYNKVSLNESVCKILAHEAMHIVLGHFNKKYKDYDKKILNIAGDLEINQIIGMQPPAIQPSNFGMPTNLTTDEYYELLINNKQNFNSTNLIKNNFSLNDDLIESFKDMKELGEDEVNNIFSEIDKIIENQNSLESSLNSIIRTQNSNIKVDYSPKKINGFEEVIKNIIHYENQVTITKTERVANWRKFNNRRPKSNLLQPGKSICSNGTKLKYNRSPVVFLDFSGSTIEINNSLTWAANELKTKCNATIVYYNNNIIDIETPGSPVLAPESKGGTNLLNVIGEYEENYAKLDSYEQLKKIYAITDGIDSSIRIILHNYDSRIWLIKDNTIVEKTLNF